MSIKIWNKPKKTHIDFVEFINLAAYIDSDSNINHESRKYQFVLNKNKQLLFDDEKNCRLKNCYLFFTWNFNQKEWRSKFSNHIFTRVCIVISILNNFIQWQIKRLHCMPAPWQWKLWDKKLHGYTCQSSFQVLDDISLQLFGFLKL